MKRPCDACSAPYEALRAWSRFCSPTCRSRARRGARAPHLVHMPTPSAGAGQLVRAVVAELEKAERLETALGQAAVAVARRIERGGDTGSAVASLTRELRATLDQAVAGARVTTSPLAQMRDELAERRRLRGRA